MPDSTDEVVGEKINHIINLSTEEITRLCNSGNSDLIPDPYDPKSDPRPFTERYHITIEEFTEVVDSNPSLRSFVSGYVAEHALEKTLPDLLLQNFPDAELGDKPDDHDREEKGDAILIIKRGGKKYKIVFESKSLQTNSVKKTETGFTAVAQVDASDKRTVEIRGEEYETTCLLFGEFDILAVPLFGFFGRWEFAFALNSELEHTIYHTVPEHFREDLIKSSQRVNFPLEKPYTFDVQDVVERHISENESTS